MTILYVSIFLQSKRNRYAMRFKTFLQKYMLATANSAVGIDARTEAAKEAQKFETLDLVDSDGSIKKLVCKRINDDVYAVFVRVRGAVAYGLEPSDFARRFEDPVITGA